MFKKVNLELNHPTIKEALQNLKKNLLSSKKGDCILLIHGYGSTGKGGNIKIEVNTYLKGELKKGNISKVFSGEDFSMNTGSGFNYDAINLRQQYKELDEYAFQRNRGITVVVV